MFERNVPNITMQSNGYWNLKTPIELTIDDESGVKSYKIMLKTDKEEKTLEYEQLINPQTSLNLKVEPPRSAYAMKDKTIDIVVEAVDVSKWNFFKGNATSKVFKLIIDKKRPKLNIISNSYKISRGGSALVIFKAEDENIKELYIESNDEKKFIPQPFYKDGYFISLLAWHINNKDFKTTVIAKDSAGNVAKAYIPLYLKQKNYRVSNIKLSDRFLKGKIAELAEEFVETQGIEGSLEQFKIINEDVRAKNEKLIHELTSKVAEDKVDSFNINKMYPLKNAQVVATFGDHRKYSYDGVYISESYHLGLDLASNAMASIKPQNGGKVVFSDYNGLYGNMPAIDHGLGLFTIYGHCSTVKVGAGDLITKKEPIANTGKSGYAMGDHLHFGVLVQGIEVRPQEWMDTQWIKLNINDVIKSAKKIIDRG
ncbi:peptidoglycan DD-metalloendopeptidase family protein [Sulfurimonas aquatica]|uniref:Peptidoglycan DD-metalloendopeptidase family protein n=2 Tax=Sulfurimonas aquatica TaxID=2672570 RepID=A0A975B2J3_9BACT|nr:peptidoglycan DD-metalloendopeptidase family protein [Sulfurimonas aquatica]